MKKLIGVIALSITCSLYAQTSNDLLKHYEAYYKQMKAQGDIQGIINAMTHLNVIKPVQARKDTLAYIYMSENQYRQALNTIGFEKNASDSDMALEVKAISLKALKQPALAIGHYQEIFKRNPNPYVAYELAELNMQAQNITEVEKHINYGLANAKDDMKKAFFETQQPYEVPLKTAFMYLNALNTFNKDRKANIDAAINILEEALKTTPNFNLAQLTKNELLRQKQELQNATTEQKN
ncbi:hypothetical protein [Neotamlana laminarinivorans]|uniref:Tetratricopeptide repeat protein n=1 Tax=Neotamlana laminarinivorans TaxID=2883124 RepID=A0A9X1HYK1_9FLAO|nr:hypothetical protein [Tamlana laminarinivorans]MCB4798499.1 hypothetical protein [Tamlana laminarinivorans]